MEKSSLLQKVRMLREELEYERGGLISPRMVRRFGERTAK
jgi:hypothetical protein